MAESCTPREARAPDAEAFRDFAERLIAGHSEAAEVLLDRYADKLQKLARSRLGQWLSAKSAPEDVLQSVLRTFYRRMGEGQVALHDWESLSGFLAVLTLRKCQRDARHYSTEARNARREVSLNVVARHGEAIELCLAGNESPPEEGAMLAELVEQLLASFGERERAILERIFEGVSVKAIAAELGCSQRTVYRTLDRVRVQLLEPIQRNTKATKLSKSALDSSFPE